MKHYTFIATYKPTKFGSNVSLNVYQIKNNKPERVGDIHYNTGSMKGNIHECLNVLLENKHITKKDFEMSKSRNSGPGYYVENKKFVIHELLR